MLVNMYLAGGLHFQHTLVFDVYHQILMMRFLRESSFAILCR